MRGQAVSSAPDMAAEVAGSREKLSGNSASGEVTTAGLMTVDEACAYLQKIPRSTMYDYIGRGYFDRAIVRFGDTGRILFRRAALDEMLEQGGTEQWRTTSSDERAVRSGIRKSDSLAASTSTGKAPRKRASEKPSEQPKNARPMRWRDAPKPRSKKH